MTERKTKAKTKTKAEAKTNAGPSTAQREKAALLRSG
jgi:hypothetical protein